MTCSRWTSEVLNTTLHSCLIELNVHVRHASLSFPLTGWQRTVPLPDLKNGTPAHSSNTTLPLAQCSNDLLLVFKYSSALNCFHDSRMGLLVHTVTISHLPTAAVAFLLLVVLLMWMKRTEMAALLFVNMFLILIQLAAFYKWVHLGPLRNSRPKKALVFSRINCLTVLYQQTDFEKDVDIACRSGTEQMVFC